MNADILSVMLKSPLFKGISNKEIAGQIASRKKSQKKLPTWFKKDSIYYPGKIQIEQTSSELTALYKASIVEGNSLIDITGGFGVDSYFLSKKIAKVIYCEIDPELFEIAAYNFSVLNAVNITPANQDGIEYLQMHANVRFDWIYIDPSRRDTENNKVYLVEDCEPDVLRHLDFLLQRSDTILIKTSPLLDISTGIKSLLFVKEIHIIAVKNEVKEVLWILRNGYKDAIRVKAINFKGEKQNVFSFYLKEENLAISNYSAPQSYLYEPNAAIMKSGAFKLVGNKYTLQKLHQHSHLYTSDALLLFPGRRFIIDTALPYNRRNVARLGVKKANITIRNFPENVKFIRKKFDIKDGGSCYLFFTTDLNDNHIVLKCSKIDN